jgi:hypothetical protein
MCTFKYKGQLAAPKSVPNPGAQESGQGKFTRPVKCNVCGDVAIYQTDWSAWGHEWNEFLCPHCLRVLLRKQRQNKWVEPDFLPIEYRCCYCGKRGEYFIGWEEFLPEAIEVVCEDCLARVNQRQTRLGARLPNVVAISDLL